MEILIFKTSIEKPIEIKMVKPFFSKIKAIKDWSFDLEDCDKILRIVADDLSPRIIETLLIAQGFNCKELE